MATRLIAFRIPAHVAAVPRVAATLAEPVANARRIKLELVITTAHDPDVTVEADATATPVRLDVHLEEQVGAGYAVVTLTALVEAADELLDLIEAGRITAPPSGRTDPYDGHLRALEVALDTTPPADPVPASDQD